MRVLFATDPTLTGELDHAGLVRAYAPARREHPLLRVNFVSSLDGAATVHGRSGPLSPPADQRLLALLRMVCDVLVVGAGTLTAERYRSLRLAEQSQQWRTARGLPPQPVLAIVTATLGISPAHPAFADAPVRPIVITHAGSPADRRRSLGAVADLLVAGADAIDLPAATAALHARGLRHVLSEGGPRLFGALTVAGLVDELCLTLSPLLAGPGAARISTGSPRPDPPHHRVDPGQPGGEDHGTTHGMRLAHLLTEDDALYLRYQRGG